MLKRAGKNWASLYWVYSVDLKELFWWVLSFFGGRQKLWDKIGYVSLLRQMQYERLRPSVATFRLWGENISFQEFRASIGALIGDTGEQGDQVNIDRAVILPSCMPIFRYHAPDISEPVASGEIKSTGQSVSVEDVIERIDKELEKNSQ